MKRCHSQTRVNFFQGPINQAVQERYKNVPPNPYFGKLPAVTSTPPKSNRRTTEHDRPETPCKHEIKLD